MLKDVDHHMAQSKGKGTAHRCSLQLLINLMSEAANGKQKAQGHSKLSLHKLVEQAEPTWKGLDNCDVIKSNYSDGNLSTGTLTKISLIHVVKSEKLWILLTQAGEKNARSYFTQRSCESSSMQNTTLTAHQAMMRLQCLSQVVEYDIQF